MTTIGEYLAIAGNDTNNNDLRSALVTDEGYRLDDKIRIAGGNPNLVTRLQNSNRNIPNGLISRFIAEADDARAAHLQAQAQAQAQAAQAQAQAAQAQGMSMRLRNALLGDNLDGLGIIHTIWSKLGKSKMT